MEFDYFLNQTPYSGATIRLPDIRYNGALGDGDFTVNTAGNTYFFDIADSWKERHFTAFCTFNKNLNNAQILLSNHFNNEGGWTIGIDDGNFLFVDCRLPYDQNHTFRNINLGNKNCLVIKRSENIFSIYKYDLLSRDFESTETFVFNPGAVLNAASNPDTNLAGNADYIGAHVNNAINYFNGTVEQFVYISGAIEDSYLLNLLSGFQPYTLVDNGSNGFILEDEVFRFPHGGAIQNNFQFLSGYFFGINSVIAAGSLPEGNWIGYVTGNFSAASLEATGSYVTGFNSCYGTGTYFNHTTVGLGVANVGVGTFVDTARVARTSNYITISHNLVVNATGFSPSPFNVDHDTYYSLGDMPDYSLVLDESYYEGFRMHGARVARDGGGQGGGGMGQVHLSTVTGLGPTGANIQAVFDNSETKFYLNKFSNGQIYYTGGKLTGNYSINNSYLTITGQNQISTHYVTYDNSIINQFIGTGIDFVTGRFFPNTSIFHSGIFPSGRLLKTQYKETSTGHLYHAAAVQNPGFIFYYSI